MGINFLHDAEYRVHPNDGRFILPSRLASRRCLRMQLRFCLLRLGAYKFLMQSGIYAILV